MLYQFNYSRVRTQMYDKKSRIKKAERIVKTLSQHFGKSRLKNLEVLDIGASTDIIDNALSKYFKNIISSDIDRDAINFAKRNFKRKNLKFILADAMKLSFKNDSFNIVICTHVYEHVPDAKKLFREIYRVLKVGGVCYLAAMNSLWPIEPHYDLPFLSYLPKKIADLYVRAFKGVSEYYEHPMTYWQLRNMLKEFRIYDYTEKILRNPQKFGYEDTINNYLLPFTFILSPLFKYFTPTMFWILEKK